MQNRQILWLGFLATLGIMATTKSVMAECGATNCSDYSGHQTYTKTSTPVDNNNGNSYYQVTTYDPDTGILSGGGIISEIESGYGFTSGSGAGSGVAGAAPGSGALGEGALGEGSSQGSGNGLAVEKGECLTSACLKAEGDPQKISLNDAAELLETTLDDSIDNLLAAEKGSSQANTVAKDSQEPRRISRSVRRDTDARQIVRNGSSCVSGCANPERPTVEARQVDNRKIAEAREFVEKRLEESQKFIEQVNSIDPEKNIW